MYNNEQILDLGDEVVDTVSGFSGIAVSRHSYFQGCNRITIQPSIDKDGKLPSTETFDEPQLKIITKNKVARAASVIDPGGPEKFSDNRKF